MGLVTMAWVESDRYLGDFCGKFRCCYSTGSWIRPTYTEEIWLFPEANTIMNGLIAYDPVALPGSRKEEWSTSDTWEIQYVEDLKNAVVVQALKDALYGNKLERSAARSWIRREGYTMYTDLDVQSVLARAERVKQDGKEKLFHINDNVRRKKKK